MTHAPAVRNLSPAELAVEIDRIRESRLAEADLIAQTAAEVRSRLQIERAVIDAERVAVLSRKMADPAEKIEAMETIHLRLLALEKAMALIGEDAPCR
jgi:hypothetical protein